MASDFPRLTNISIRWSKNSYECKLILHLHSKSVSAKFRICSNKITQYKDDTMLNFLQMSTEQMQGKEYTPDRNGIPTHAFFIPIFLACIFHLTLQKTNIFFTCNFFINITIIIHTIIKHEVGDQSPMHELNPQKKNQRSMPINGEGMWKFDIPRIFFSFLNLNH